MMAVTSSPGQAPIEANNAERKKRNSSPGVRVVGKRIYDSQNGTTCHQCRQKTRDFAAPCKNLKGLKHCTLQFCHKCLFNRYGENAEDVKELADWKCPRCRGTCNCSLCMKKRGLKPTGILAPQAKRFGLGCVASLLQVEDSAKLLQIADRPSEMAASSDKDFAGILQTADSVQDDHQSLDEVGNDKRERDSILEESDSKKPKLAGENKEDRDGQSGHDAELVSRDDDSNVGAEPEKKVQTFKGKSSAIAIWNVGDSCGKIRKDAALINDVGAQSVKEERCAMEVSGGGNSKNAALASVVGSSLGAKPNKSRKKKKSLLAQNKELDFDVQLPEGVELITVAGFDLSPRDAANALQFLEFCAAMGEVIDFKKGQAEALLRELFRGRASRRGQYSPYSSIVRFHVKLLTLIQEDMGEEAPLASSRGKNSWVLALGKCISESPCAPENIPSDCLGQGAEGYDNLDFSTKLTLLNFICDEALQTMHLRNWMDLQNSKFVDEQRETKRKVHAAKEKTKEIKQRMQDNLARAIIEKNGAPITAAEHESIVSKIKNEAADAAEKVLEAEGLILKKGQVSSALRTQPIISDNGRIFWQLNSYTAEPNILCQDLGTRDATAMTEKWIAYDAEQKEEIEHYISSIRRKRYKTGKARDSTPDMNSAID